MNYKEEIQKEWDNLYRLGTEFLAAKAEVRRLDEEKKAVYKRIEMLENLQAKRRPYLVGKGSYTNCDMMGKGGTYDISQEIVWDNSPPAKRLYALELENDLETIKSVGYIGNRGTKLSLEIQKQVCDLPHDSSLDPCTNKCIEEWRKYIDELRELLG